jgi:hypothetical protein
VVGFILVFDFQDAALWYRSTSQAAPTRLERSDAVLGEYVLRLDIGAPVTPSWISDLFQPVPLEDVSQLGGQTVTLGAWMWASQPVEVNMPVLQTEGHSFSRRVQLDTEPQFFSVQAPLPENTARLWLALALDKTPAMADVEIYYDALVLAKGERPLDQPPVFSSAQGEKGEWGDKPFENLLRNASAENSGLRLRPWIDQLGARFMADHTRPSLIWTSLWDFSGAFYLYQFTAQRLFRTFWATFGWGHVSLAGSRPYRILGFVTLVGGIGFVVYMLRRWRDLPWDLIFFLGLALIASWGTTFVRGAIYLGVYHLYLPVARYAYPAIIPTVLFLNVGWLEIEYILRLGWRKIVGVRQVRWTPAFFSCFRQHLRFVVYLALFLSLDILAIWSVAGYYEIF